MKIEVSKSENTQKPNTCLHKSSTTWEKVHFPNFANYSKQNKKTKQTAEQKGEKEEIEIQE